MPTTRKYTFDIDTKRYLNRVNTYRSLNGIPAIANGDAVDIDNFIIGLKDLGIWHNSVMWLLRSTQNIGTGLNVLSMGGLDIFNGTMVGTSTWTLNGITFGGASFNSYISLSLNLKNYTGFGSSIFGCLNYQIGVISDDNFYIYHWQDNDGEPTYSSLAINTVSTQGVVPVVTRNNTRYFQSNRGGALPTGFSTVAGVFNLTSQSAYKNGTVISTESNLGIMNPYASTSAISAPASKIGRGNGTIGGVSVPISLICNKPLTTGDMTSLHNLYKATIGKGLGLP